MRRTTSCSTCRREVPAGRWCNWCGALLGVVPASRALRRLDPRALAAAGVVAVLAVGVVLAPRGDGTAGVDRAPTAVVLAEDAPLPPSPSSTGSSPPSTPAEPPGERVDVICSDLRVRSVPVADVATDVPGELVELANGTCVVMGPEGAVAP